MNFAKAIRARHKAWFDDIGISEYVPLRINEDGLEMMVKAISPHLQSGYTCTGWTNGLGFLLIHRVGASYFPTRFRTRIPVVWYEMSDSAGRATEDGGRSRQNKGATW